MENLFYYFSILNYFQSTIHNRKNIIKCINFYIIFYIYKHEILFHRKPVRRNGLTVHP
ncbi:hypothetical protein DGI_3341 [Megalodesulfovibrio gigas DSM 1382 = ATCC 19364]|uniref:Uncharacterized protein n=1 Tax=Megalodesulfovibrio gigas (strain ATCC 19364 / DSM 1382 / NCIMB 9332 / VKM B-1759) TaxID=1121448 RepID=T2GFQ9_MEGG1|nr:hypothetical protein DGI_3341 [Megalodesulfovibrio gigas DSM 1382 = ATCC 19364]